MTQKKVRAPKVSPEPKQLTTEDILSLATEHDETKPITIDVKGRNFTVNINKYFRKSKLQLIAIKFISYADKLKQNPDVTEETIIGIFQLIPTLLIKEFSNTPIEYEINSIEDLIHVQTNLMDLEILDQVYNAFDKKEIKQAEDMMKSAMAEAGRIMGDIAVQQSLKGIEQHANVQQPE